jgi:hypothetical protein
MRKMRLLGGSIAAAAMLLLAVPAFAATPSQNYRDFYKDLADNGRLDGKYSPAQLQRALQDTLVQGYRNPIVVAKMKQKPKGGVQGDKTRGGASPARGGLPFTGAQLGLFMVVGLSLVGSGLLLRLTGRKKSEKSG